MNLAESQGVEPCERITTLYGLAIRCITILPTLGKTLLYSLSTVLSMVPPAGVEPTLANYLLHTGYKSAVLPLNYRGIFGAS